MTDISNDVTICTCVVKDRLKDSYSLFNSINHDPKEKIETNLSKVFTNMKVPHSFARNTRDFQSVLSWRANKYKIFQTI
jgi:hypothetical protein